MKKAEYKEMDTKDLRARLETAEKEYLQTKVNHSISLWTILQRLHRTVA